MLFATEPNTQKRITPSPRFKGAVCPLCGSPVQPVCGERKVWHWRHLANSHCENAAREETEWHRQWKNKFPEECQEIVHYDSKTNEKHVADVEIPDGLVIEFQHSPLVEEERLSRETFYKNMVWVVDCSVAAKGKVSRARKRLEKKFASSYVCLEIFKNVYAIPGEEGKLFPPKWINSTVPVFFDFGDEIKVQDSLKKDYLICLLPKQVNGIGIMLTLGKERFIERIQSKKDFLMKDEIYKSIYGWLNQECLIPRNQPLEIKQRKVDIPVSPTQQEETHEITCPNEIAREKTNPSSIKSIPSAASQSLSTQEISNAIDNYVMRRNALRAFNSFFLRNNKRRKRL